MIKQIGTVAIYVEDQQKALEYWTEKVGFEVVKQFPMGPEAFWLEVAPAGSQTRLVIYPKTMMKDHAERKASIVFECEDIDRTYEELKNRGVLFIEEPQKMPWGTFVRFNDVDGNEFLLKS